MEVIGFSFQIPPFLRGSHAHETQCSSLGMYMNLRLQFEPASSSSAVAAAAAPAPAIDTCELLDQLAFLFQYYKASSLSDLCSIAAAFILLQCKSLNDSIASLPLVEQVHIHLTIPACDCSSTSSSSAPAAASEYGNFAASDCKVNAPEQNNWGTVDVIHELERVGLYRLNVAPGKAIPWHIHKIMNEAEMIVSHELLCCGSPVRWGIVHCWGMSPHGYENTSDTVQSILCVDIPKFIPSDEIVIHGEELNAALGHNSSGKGSDGEQQNVDKAPADNKNNTWVLLDSLLTSALAKAGECTASSPSGTALSSSASSSVSIVPSSPSWRTCSSSSSESMLPFTPSPQSSAHPKVISRARRLSLRKLRVLHSPLSVSSSGGGIDRGPVSPSRGPLSPGPTTPSGRNSRGGGSGLFSPTNALIGSWQGLSSPTSVMVNNFSSIMEGLRETDAGQDGAGAANKDNGSGSKAKSRRKFWPSSPTGSGVKADTEGGAEASVAEEAERKEQDDGGWNVKEEDNEGSIDDEDDDTLLPILPTFVFPGAFPGQYIQFSFDPSTFDRADAVLVLIFASLSAATAVSSSSSLSSSSPSSSTPGRRLLFVKHRSRGWELPGGKVDNGESAEEACIREVKEEAGIKLTTVALLGQYSMNTGGGVGGVEDGKHVKSVYVACTDTLDNGSASKEETTLSKETSERMWMSVGLNHGDKDVLTFRRAQGDRTFSPLVQDNVFSILLRIISTAM